MPTALFDAARSIGPARTRPLRPAGPARFWLIFAIGVVVIAARRWAQFKHPGVWIEDGVLVLPSFAEHGWSGLLLPVQGYLVIPCKLISYVALLLSFRHYALISTVLATAAQSACAGAFACAPTVLPARWAMALAVLLLPTGSEAFALPIYVLWWTTLLVFAAIFWRNEARQWPRLAGLAVGALSSPMVILLLPVFGLRAAVERRRSHLVAAIAALALSALQAFVIMREQTHQSSLLGALARPDILVSKYFGTALYGLDLHGAGLFGCLMLVVLTGGWFVVPRPDRFAYFLLGLCLGAAVVSSVARVPVEAPHPLLAGPRYFFYPTACILWMLIWVVARAERPAAFLAACFVGAYLPFLSRALPYTDQVPAPSWPKQVDACAKSETYTFQLQYAGWQTTLRGEECRQLIRHSLLDHG